MNKKIRLVEGIVNFAFFFVGLYGLWGVTRSWYALGWCFIASLHFNIERFLEEKEPKL